VRPKLRSCEVRASVRDRTRSPSFRSDPAIPGAAARVRTLSEAGPKSLGSGQTPLQSLAFRGVLRDTLRRFTPPRTCCWPGECVGFVLGDRFPTDRLPCSSTFQAFMNDIFSDLVDDGHLVVYLDDILLFHDDLAKLHRLTHEVL
jgi:hypothetical protein